MTDQHVLQLRADGWTIMHPLRCRPNLFACPVTAAAERTTWLTYHLAGVYECDVDEHERFTLGKSTTVPDAADEELTGWQDLVWLVAHGYEVSVEAGDNRTGEVCGADVAVRLDRVYQHDEWDRVETFWGEERGTAGALKRAREWAEEHDQD